jgi:hypothetical protein
MIITLKKYGRLANRLFLYSHLIAFAEKEDLEIINFAFDDYKNYFPFFHGQFHCSYVPMTHDRAKELGNATWLHLKARLKLIPKVCFWDERDIIFDGADEGDERIQLLIRSKQIVFEGWKFRSHLKIIDIMPILREIFRPLEKTEQSAMKQIRKARNRGEIVVGVHVRWEDYRGSANYFQRSEYHERMAQIGSLLHPKKVCYLICSSETLHQEDFPLDCIITDNAEHVDDLYSLSKCDYIIGPASTFSRWASFYGGKPLITMIHGRRIKELTEGEVISW